jgi:Flp pilus assembly protein TadD
MPVMAVAPLSRAVERSPKNASYRYHLGLAYAKSGETTKSRAALVRALELEGSAEWSAEARRLIAGFDASSSR